MNRAAYLLLIVLSLGTGYRLLGEPAVDPQASPEILVDEILLRPDLSLRIHVGQPETDPGTHPLRVRGYARFVLLNLRDSEELFQWTHGQGTPRRTHSIVRVILADWATDGALIVLYIVADHVFVSNISLGAPGGPVRSSQALFRRGPLGGTVWEVLRAELDETHPNRMTLNIMTRGYDGSLNVIPVHRNLDDPDGRWTYDRSVMGNVMYADQDTVWRRDGEDQ